MSFSSPRSTLTNHRYSPYASTSPDKTVPSFRRQSFGVLYEENIPPTSFEEQARSLDEPEALKARLPLPSSVVLDGIPQVKIPPPAPRLKPAHNKENQPSYRGHLNDDIKRCFEQIETKHSRVQDVFYFPMLRHPLRLPVDLSAEPRFSPNHVKQFVRIQTLKGSTKGPGKLYIAVYCPYDEHDFNNFVVLKRYKKKTKKGVSMDPKSAPVASLRRELQVFKRLASGNDRNREFLVDIDASVEDFQYYYLIMPLFRCDLAHVLMGQSDINRHDFAKAWITQMALGLDCLHSHGIIHCNLKPTNVLVHWDGSIKIGDFVSVYIAEGDKPLKHGVKYAYKYRGAEAYMAPEQREVELIEFEIRAEHDKEDYDERNPALKEFGFGKEVDIWSLGCVAAELLRDDQHKILFYDDKQRRSFVTGDRYDRRCQLSQYNIATHFQIEFLLGLLDPNPAKRTKINDFWAYDYYTSSHVSFEKVAARRLKDDSPEFALKCDLGSTPRSRDVVKVNTAKIVEEESCEDYTWVNPMGRWS